MWSVGLSRQVICMSKWLQDKEAGETTAGEILLWHLYDDLILFWHKTAVLVPLGLCQVYV